ncbi:MAG: hypothetical protein LDL30_01245 [Desulfovibrio sp.]|nr:hypothetical protein [Desulfovibrio sp.]MCA1985308.1 hypothetical protein [Desulfovibrio sp.]
MRRSDVFTPEAGSGSVCSLQYREELLSRILQRKHSFAETAGKRYLLSLGRSLISMGAGVARSRADSLQGAADSFRQAVAALLDSHYLGRLLGVMKVVIEESSRDPELGFLPGPQAEAVADAFLDDLTATFVAHFAQSLRVLCGAASMQGEMPEVQDAAARFRGDMTSRIRRLNVELVALYCQMHRSLQAAHGQSRQSREKRAQEERVPRLLDAFGRGLLHPVDCQRGIEACCLTSDTHFPRLLCAPVLQALRCYVIGSEKYDATNRKILQSIYRYCTAESQFQRSRLAEYFEEPHVRQYLLAYLLHILNVLCEESKVEAFSNVVQSHLAALPLDMFPSPVAGSQRDAKGLGVLDAPTFCATHRAMLLQAWAQYCLGHLEVLPGRRRAVKILRHHLPGLMIPDEDELAFPVAP